MADKIFSGEQKQDVTPGEHTMDPEKSKIVDNLFMKLKLIAEVLSVPSTPRPGQEPSGLQESKEDPNIGDHQNPNE